MVILLVELESYGRTFSLPRDLRIKEKNIPLGALKWAPKGLKKYITIRDTKVEV
jgi:hypothetical protein